MRLGLLNQLAAGRLRAIGRDRKALEFLFRLRNTPGLSKAVRPEAWLQNEGLAEGQSHLVEFEG